MAGPEQRQHEAVQHIGGMGRVEPGASQRPPRNDRDALRDFYEENFDAVYRFVYLLLGGHHQDAEEAVQNAFLAAIRSLDSLRNRGNPRSWLFGIARHKAADVRRKRALERGLWEKLGIRWKPTTLNDPAADAVSTGADVERALLSLPLEQREVLILKYVEDLPVEEVAVLMRRSAKATESLLSRARAGFRKAYPSREQG